jgi:hypothetical protein
VIVAAAIVTLAVGSVALWVSLRSDEQTIGPITNDSAEAGIAAPRCSESVVGDNVTAFVNEFMRRRVDGSGAEACVSSGVLEAYGSDGLCLSACGRFRVAGFTYAEDPHDAAVANTYVTTVSVTLSDGDQTMRRDETLDIGPGTTSTDERQAFVITRVRATPEGAVSDA